MRRKVLIVDDDVMVSKTWTRILRACKYQVDAATSVENAKINLANACYHAVLIDLRLPGQPGTDLVTEMCRSACRPGIAVISGFLDAADVVKYRDAVDLFVPKPIGRDDLIRVVDTLVTLGKGSDRVTAFCQRVGLSGRETEVLVAAAQGLQNKEIATKLASELSSVITYWRRIYGKTGCHSRNEVLAKLLQDSADSAT